jgi:hypothetical protein
MVAWNVNCPTLESWIQLWIEGTLTFTSPCHSDTLPLPSFSRFMIRGMFLIPFKWLCSWMAVAMFSDRMKQSTASCLDLMIGMERQGRRSHVRRSERPNAVLLPFNIPEQLLGMRPSVNDLNTYRIVIILLWSYRSGRKRGFHFQIHAGS